MFTLLFTLVSCVSCAPGQEQTAPRVDPDPQQVAQGGDVVPQPDLQDLVEGDLRRRDMPSGQLDTSESGYFGWLFLEWGGARQQLEDLGLSIEMLTTTDASLALAGGADPGGDAFRSLLDLTFTYDTEPALGLKGGTLHAGLQWISGVDASTRFGVLQPFSNIDSERRLQVGRLWYEQYLQQTGTRLRLGKIDANSLFAYVDTGSHFLHSSMGFSPTVFPMPTYPDASYGVALVQGLVGGLQLSGGLFDGSLAYAVRTGQHGPSSLFESPHGLFLIGEADYAWSTAHGGRVGLGVWKHTADFERFDGGVQSGTSGTYALLDQRLWNHPRNESESLDAFVQLGWASPEVSPFETHLGFGTVWSNPFAPRSDKLGLGVSHVGLSGEPGAGFTEGDETAIELFYGFEPVPWARIKPDLQYVIHPGGDATLDNAWIATIRFTLSL